MKLRIGSMALLVMALATPFALDVAPAQAQEQHRVSGTEVAIYNLAGEVEVVRGGGSDVVVEVTRGGSDASQLDVAISEIGGRQTLRVIYPADEIVYGELGRGSKSTVRVRDDGTFFGGSGGREVEIKGSGGGLEAWADLRISVPAGKDVAVYQAIGAIEAQDVVSDLRLDTGSGSIRAEGIRGSLHVDTGSGSVFVRAVEGNVLIDTGSGGVDVWSVTGDELHVDTGSGSIEGGDLTSESMIMDTGSGGVSLAEVSCPEIRVDTGSGSVELELLADVDMLEIDTGSGGVVLYIPEGLGGELEIDVGSGGIDVDVPVEVERARRSYFLGTIGDGRGTIEIDTGAGGVRVRRR